MSTPVVVVLGGGPAGLVAACALADRGLGVTLVEAEPRLGGTAATLTDPRSGLELDLAPPVWLAGGDGFAAWLAKLGAGDRLLDTDVTPVRVLMPGHESTFVARALPRAIRLTRTLLSFDALEPVDRARAAVGALLVRVGRPLPRESDSLYRWLRRAGQPKAAIDRLWNPLCIAACGLPVEEVAAELALPALAPSLGAGVTGMRFALAKLSWEKLINPLVHDALLARRAAVITGSPARRLVVVGSRVTAVELADGRKLRADGVVAALPPAALLAALPESWRPQGPFAMVKQQHLASRASVHLVYDRPPLDTPVAVACGEEACWLVSRRRSGPLSDQRAAGAAHGVSVYPAAGSALGTLPREEAIARADALVRSVAPEAAGAQLVHALVATQSAAVLLSGPGSATLRPWADTPIANMWLASAWTATGLPGGLDGAVRAGRRAAAAAAENVATSANPVR